ncbi:uncharacterized protein [Littorina saxatilis]|uniref:Uncharacterized protein n=1 Tax=Littorina saxatilis TaxID=31220 RepID=A0AAN9BLZ7_9CAEN
MAWAFVTSLLAGLVGVLLLTSASAGPDLSKCQPLNGQALPMGDFLSRLSRRKATKFYVTALTRELQPNTVSVMLSLKALRRKRYLMTTTANVRGASGVLQCVSIDHTLHYNQQERRLESKWDVYSYVVHVYLLANDAEKGRTAFYVELKRDGKKDKSLSLIDLLTSDPSTESSSDWASDAVKRICVDSDVFFDSLSVNASMKANCGN